MAVDEVAITASMKATAAVSLSTAKSRPDFAISLFITATPDDQDVARSTAAGGIKELHRISVSRKDAVDAGLIKDGLQARRPEGASGLWLDGHQRRLADAIMRGSNQAFCEWRRLTPLMLAPLEIKDSATMRRRPGYRRRRQKSDCLRPRWTRTTICLSSQRRIKRGIDLKVAVALGFDAPASLNTLVRMRSAKDSGLRHPSVGRILRVHHRLQAKALAKTSQSYLIRLYLRLTRRIRPVPVPLETRLTPIQTELSWKVSV